MSTEMAAVNRGAMKEVQNLLQQAHWKARALEDQLPARRQDRLADAIHAARRASEALRHELELLAA